MTDIIIQFFQDLAHRLIHSMEGLPWVVVFLLVLAFILIILIVLLTFIGMRRAAKKAAKDSPLSQEQENPYEYRLPPVGGWISEFLSRKGMVRVGSLSLSFLKALEFLKEALNTYNYKYQLPWYLLIGAEGSGKTSLIEGADITFPFGRQDFDVHHPNPECQWWFLNRGVLLDIRGDLLLRQNTPSSHEKGWRSLLVLLSRYRAARPINGIILTIPVTELYGRHCLSSDEISARAEYLAQKLSATQNGLGLRLPVYILMTKVDCIPGFQSFCSEIPAKNRRNMLGWSSPYTLQKAFTSSWIEEAFSSIQENLSQLRLEIFAESPLSVNQDGVFIFPSELMTIKDNLSIYLNHLFKNNTYQEPMALRGIYFCGDSGLTLLKILDDQEGNHNESEVSSLPLDEPHLQLVATANSSAKRKIFFIEDLINQKILQESGLAVAQQQKILNVNRILNVAKISTFVFIIFGSYGLYNAYDTFIKSRNNIMPVLSKMNGLLYDLRNLTLNQPVHSNELFDSYARELIEMMDQLNQTDFFSIFVPASWFSLLYEDLNKTLKVSYQQIIIRTIYIDLLLKAKNLLHLRPTLQDQSQSLSQLLLPLTTPEYYLLKRYIEGLVTLEDKIKQFNSLKEAGNYRDLSDLVSFTFGGQLPKQFADQYHRFQKLLSNTVFPPIDLRPYQNLARETLIILYQNFLNALFNAGQPHSLAGRLNQNIRQLSQQETHHLPDVNNLRRFSMELAQAMPGLGEIGQTWVDKEFFNPHKEFDELLDKIDNFELFGKDFTQYLVDQTAIGFNGLKQNLKAINQVLTDQLVNPISDPLTTQAYSYSQGLISLSKSLIKLFSEPYMGLPSGRPFTNVVPPGKIIYWDSKLIQLAYDMCKRFEEFSVKEISNFPPLLHENLKLLARQSLQNNIVDLVARAQSFIELPDNLSQGLAAEEVLRSKIADVREVAPKFAKLLEILNLDSVGFSFVELRDLLASTSYWLLLQVETMLQNLNPYIIQDITFEWWDGQSGAALAGYSAHDIEDLKTYLQLQRQQIQNMAIEFAKPLITFLTIPSMTEAVGDKTLLNRWKRIIDQVEACLKKQPGNSISLLEDFIMKQLNTYDIKNIFSDVSVAHIQQASGDYFVEIIRILKKSALGRAEILRRQQSIKNYQELANYFNKYLKGKFPFVGSSLSLTTAEADPEDIRTFFGKYDHFGGSVKEIINQVYQLGPATTPMVIFLKQMQQVKEFFDLYLKGQNEGDIPAFEFSVDFRANRSREIGGDMIVDWSLRPDEDTIIYKNDKVRQGHWIYGKPVQVTFRWPQGHSIPIKPVRDPSQPLLTVDEKTATFTYQGNWALFWMLRLQLANKGDYSILQDPNPHMLKFVIPTSSVEKTIVYNLLTLSLPSQNPKKPGKTVRFPSFPVIAPKIPNEVLEYQDQAVLTEGYIEASPLDFEEIPSSQAAKIKDSSRDEEKEKKPDKKVSTKPENKK